MTAWQALVRQPSPATAVEEKRTAARATAKSMDKIRFMTALFLESQL
jgi:hypothetical protein